MNIPYNKEVNINYYDTGIYQFQLIENGSPVSDDLTKQNIKFQVRGSGNFTPIIKDIVTENWVVDNTNKIIKVEIDTETLGMQPSDSTAGQYTGRIEWVDRKFVLVILNITISPNELWSLEV